MKAIAFTLILLGSFAFTCSTDSGDDILVGKWGGKGLGIRATQHLTRIDMPCASGTLPGAIAVEADGTFEFETTLHEFYGDYEVYVEGLVKSGTVLEVEVSTEYDRPGSEPFLLVNGAEPDFRGYACLGSNR